MTANKKAVQVRVSLLSASQAGGQRAHDLRIGPQPDYVDEARSHLNRIQIAPLKGVELRKLCEDRRAQRDTQRAMKANAAVGVAGIITFGHEAQPIFEALSPAQQDAAYREVAEAIAARLNTTLTGLVSHGDEASPHAHFQCPGVTLDGQPVSRIAKREALRDLQTIAAEVMQRHASGIERGKSRQQRMAEGESYADTVYKTAADMRANLPLEAEALRAEIAALEAKRGEAEAKLETQQRHLSNARQKSATEGSRAAAAKKRADTYEARAAKAQETVDQITAEIDRARAFLADLEARQAKLEAAAQEAEAKREAAEKRAEEVKEERRKAAAALKVIEAQKAAKSTELDGLESAVAQKKTSIETSRARIAALQARLQSLNAP